MEEMTNTSEYYFFPDHIVITKYLNFIEDMGYTMKILFIQPCSHLKGIKNNRLSLINKLIVKLYMLCPSLSFSMLAAVTPKEHSITMIDERCKKINFSKKYDLVGITAMTNEATRAYELGDEFRKRGVTVVFGGPHVSALPEEAINHADSVVIGEAEELCPIFLKDFEKHEIKLFYQQENPIDLSNIPPPKRSITERCLIQNGVQTSRGCPHGCKYCFIGNSPQGSIFRKRPIEQVIKEIKKIPQRVIVFYDSSLTIDLDHTKSLFKAMKGLKKSLICLGNINILKENDELLKLSKEAGCIQWNIGFESVSQQSLNEVNKMTNKVESYYEAIEKIHSYGMNVHGFFMFGFDHDNKEIFDQTWDFIQKSKIDSASFSLLTPLPGTPLFDELSQQGRILTKDWWKYGYNKNLVFKAKNFSETEIREGYKKIYQNYYSWIEIAERFANSIKRGISFSKIIIFLIENIFSRPHLLMHSIDKQ